MALRNYPAIAEYPLQMTKAMAQRSWLERFDQKRIIIQQSHPAMCYYIILSGSGQFDYIILSGSGQCCYVSLSGLGRCYYVIQSGSGLECDTRVALLQ